MAEPAIKTTVRVDGLAELVKAVRKIDPTTAKEMRPKLVALAGKVLAAIRPGMVRGPSGRFADSAKVRATSKSAGIAWSRASVPYAGAVEFGGYPKGRPYIASGRYIFPVVDQMRGQIEAEVSKAMDELIESAGLS